jgi:NitT/TauT family transport system ATP-binding protein
MIEQVGLTKFRNHFPYELSGGMQQRVAIARALVCHPDVLLMDEPFSAVDALTRSDLQDGLLRLWADLRPTIIFITHDIDEAIYLSEQVVVLSRAPSRVSQSILIDVPYPRDQIETRELPSVLQHRRRILADIHSRADAGTAR